MFEHLSFNLCLKSYFLKVEMQHISAYGSKHYITHEPQALLEL